MSNVPEISDPSGELVRPAHARTLWRQQRVNLLISDVQSPELILGQQTGGPEAQNLTLEQKIELGQLQVEVVGRADHSRWRQHAG
jgi:hypothetical protein